MPYKDPAKRTAYLKEYRQRPAAKQAEKERNAGEFRKAYKNDWSNQSTRQRQFFGVDGEGADDANGRHNYLLLRVGPHILFDNNRPLGTYEILRWLTSDTVVNSPANLISFAFDYDVTMIIRDWPEHKLRELFDRPSRTFKDAKGHPHVAPVLHNDFYVEYLPHKHFRVKRYGAKRGITIHDTHGFFQSSFVTALTTWDIGTPDEREAIRVMKNHRSEFTGMSEAEITYNRRECEMLCDMIEHLRDMAADLGYTITPYEGAGNLAQSMLRVHNSPTPETTVPMPDELQYATIAAYYGGRFEISQIGMIPLCHEYDIASAYPHAMTLLPCLEHGYWDNADNVDATIQIQHVRWRSVNRDSTPWGPFPFRDPNGTILYPYEGSGWYWRPEVEAAYDGGFKLRILDTWSWIQECDHKPFAWVEDVYNQRRAMGKNAKGKVLKLGANSLYGKVAQSVGVPKFANSVYAGLITSITRARMAVICNKYGNSVKMIATDGIYLDCEMTSDDPIVDANTGKPNLGDWEHGVYTDLFLVKPGIYFAGDGSAKIRTRGVPKAALEAVQGELIQSWNNAGMNGYALLNVTKFYGARLCTQMNRPDLMGQWENKDYFMQFKSNNLKRLFLDTQTALDNGMDFRNDGKHWSISRLHSRLQLESTPYKRTFGLELSELTELEYGGLLESPYDDDLDGEGWAD